MMVLDRPGMAKFARAVARVSAGQVRVEELSVPVAEAVALWSDLVAAFRGKDAGTKLSEFERFSLVRSAIVRSGGRVRVQAGPVGSIAGRAIWRVACRVGDWTVTAAAPGAWKKGASVVGVAIMASQLAACATMLGGNVKGNFSCSAPGGTCAPSTVIDDQALSVIQNARPMTPAGPYYQPDRQAAPQTAGVTRGGGQLLAASDGVLHRDRRMLKVVFPSFVDGKGNLHGPRVVHTVADAGGWMQVTRGEANAGQEVVGRAEALSAVRPTATLAVAGSGQQGELAGISSAESRTWDLQSVPAISATPQMAAATGLNAGPGVSGPPDPRVVEAARLRAPKPGPNPLDAIRADVAQRLGTLSVNGNRSAASEVPGSPSGTVAVGAPAAAPVVAPVAAKPVPPKEASVFPTKVGE